MHCKDQSNHRRKNTLPRHAREEQEQEGRVERMDNHIGCMKCSRVETVERVRSMEPGVKLEREPRQRMVVGCVKRRECPRHIGTSRAAKYVRITRHIREVIVIDKIALERSPVCDDSYKSNG